MRVICVDQASGTIEQGVVRLTRPDEPQVVVGNTYTVYDTITDHDGTFYCLVGFPSDTGFHANLFATLPEATATELYEEEFEGVMQ